MDYSNADRVGRSNGNPLRVALLVALIAALVAICLYSYRNNGSPAAPDNAEYVAFSIAAERAEMIADPLQRCLQYPDLPGSHWHAETTKAYCELRTRRTLQLSEIEALLQQGHADVVDRTFQSYLDAQRHDPKQPGVFDASFYSAGFDESDRHTRAVIDQWKRQSPQSAFALAASGMQYVDAAQQARGNGWAKDLRDDQVDGMHQQLELARADLDRAVALLPTITMAYASMINAGGMGADDEYQARAAARGIAVQSADFSIRAGMMNKAQRKWGSQFGGEDEQQRENEALIPQNPLLRMVADEPAAHRATCDCTLSNAVDQLLPAADGNLSYIDLESLAQEAYNNDAPRLSAEFYSEAIRFNPSDVDSLQWRAEALRRIGDVKGAVTGMEQAAQRFPENNAIGTQLALFYAHTGKVARAETEFLGVLKRDPDNKIAMANLGDLYNHGAHRPDKAEALADTLIDRYPDYAGGYIVRACNQMDHNLAGRYDTIHYFIDHFGDNPDFKSQVAEMRAYLKSHPEKIGMN